jgi:hypothetical protein
MRDLLRRRPSIDAKNSLKKAVKKLSLVPKPISNGERVSTTNIATYFEIYNSPGVDVTYQEES